MNKVSVIVAAYNVEKYITGAMNSLISQTLKDIEIIAVDDCSTDGTGAILARFAEVDERVRIVRHEKNRGLMTVRKTGVSHATGEYIMFLDGDDRLNTDACEKAYDTITKEKVDVLQFDTKIFSDDARIKESEKRSQYAYLNDSVSKALSSVRSGECPTLSARQKHLRECYVVAKEGADKAKIEQAIKTMPNYFADYDTTVTFISQEELNEKHGGMPHGGSVLRTGKTGLEGENGHTVEFRLALDSNPEFTGSVLVACARAIDRMAKRRIFGCKTVFDIAPADLSILTPEELRAHML